MIIICLRYWSKLHPSSSISLSTSLINTFRNREGCYPFYSFIIWIKFLRLPSAFLLSFTHLRFRGVPIVAIPRAPGFGTKGPRNLNVFLSFFGAVFLLEARRCVVGPEGCLPSQDDIFGCHSSTYYMHPYRPGVVILHSRLHTSIITITYWIRGYRYALLLT